MLTPEEIEEYKKDREKLQKKLRESNYQDEEVIKLISLIDTALSLNEFRYGKFY
jgi:hypothetical protein